MQSKWFQFVSWRSQADADPQEGAAGTQTAAPQETANSKQTSTDASGGARFASSDLVAFEEIYRSAGIPAPRLGYSITKVVGMLSNEHIRDLPSETKRASLMMALEAAGIQVNEVLQDATLRQHAINSYESAQKKRLEQFEARKAQENRDIQGEMDRVTAQYLARINGNLDCVAREKDAFRKWQVQKQEEAQQMAEAVALCVKHQGSQPEDESVIALRELSISVEPSFSKR